MKQLRRAITEGHLEDFCEQLFWQVHDWENVAPMLSKMESEVGEFRASILLCSIATYMSYSRANSEDNFSWLVWLFSAKT